jgi:DNA polymerase elongation subunit (family B)
MDNIVFDDCLNAPDIENADGVEGDANDCEEDNDLSLSEKFNLSKLYYKTTKRANLALYNRDAYLQECKDRTRKCDPNSSVNIIITKVETQYVPSVINDIFSKENIETQIYGIKSKHFLVEHGKQDGKFKDLIFVRGKTIPTQSNPISKTVLAYVSYKWPYGPKIYLESREGFDDYASYEEVQQVQSMIDTEANVSNCSSGPSKFIRWIQNYMFMKTQERKRLRESGMDNYSSDANNNFYFDPNSILSFSYALNVPGYKSVWGRIPDPDDDGPNRHILEITLTTKSCAKKFTQFFESDEYLNLVAKKFVPTIRTFECNFSFDIMWRFQHDIDFGCSYLISNYKEMTPEQIGATFIDINQSNTLCINFDYNQISRSDESLPYSFARCTTPLLEKCKPLKLTFDIESYTPIDPLIGSCFPVAKWTAEKYGQRYKSVLSEDEYNSIIYCKTEAIARAKTISILMSNQKAKMLLEEKGHKSSDQKRRFLESSIPKVEMADPITVIAGAIRQNEKGNEIFSEHGGFAYTWKCPYNKNWQRTTFNNIKSSNYFKNMNTMVFTTEYDMIMAFMNYMRKWNPDFICGHNVLGFDLPYIIDRIEHLKQFGQFGSVKSDTKPFTFSIIRGHKSSYYSTNFSRNGAQRTSYSVRMPGVAAFDSMKAAMHETFGIPKLPSYNLSYLMSQKLLYPNSDMKMRKLEIDVKMSSKLWENGGDGLAYFVAYCIFDAIGSVMIIELYNFINMMFFVSECSGATPESIYLKGAQNIVITMFYKMVWLSSKKYLFPDYGTRELHFLDLWYWHYGHDKEYKDVRDLYESVPSLKRKWQNGGLRLIPDLRSKSEVKILETNPYFPKKGTPEYVYSCYSEPEIKKKKKDSVIPKTKAYIGGYNFQVFRGYYINEFILTSDFLSMYPTSAVAFCLDFPNLVTEFTKKAFNIPRICLLKIVLGPENLIQMGDVCTDKALAKERGINDTDKLVYTYYYQDDDQSISIFPRMIRYLLASRREANLKKANWAFQVGRMHYLLEMCSKSKSIWNRQSQYDIKSYLKNESQAFRERVEGKGMGPAYGDKKLFEFINKANGTDFDSLSCFLEKAIFELENNTLNVMEKKNITSVEDLEHIEKLLRLKLLASEIEYIVYNTEQNSKKLTMNSGYGVVSMRGIFPQIQLGSSITALCRYLIFRESNSIENTDLLQLVLDLGLKDSVETLCGKNIAELREKYKGKIYNPIITNGDTDSTIYALRGELLPCPEAKDIVRFQIGGAIASGTSRFLPKVYSVPTTVPMIIDECKQIELDKVKFVVEDKAPGVMKSQDEKTAFSAVIIKPKNYIQNTLEENEQYKGIASKKSDTNPQASRLEKEGVKKFLIKAFDRKTETKAERLNSLLSFLKKEILSLIQGNYDPSEFEMKTKLNKPIEVYKLQQKKLPTHVAVAIKKVERGDEVRVGDYITYLYTMNSRANIFSDNDFEQIIKIISNISDTPKENSHVNVDSMEQYAKNMQTLESLYLELINSPNYDKMKDGTEAEDSQYVIKNNIPLDILYYLEFKIFPKLQIFLAPLIHSYKQYPRIPFGSKKADKKIIKGIQQSVEKKQKERAYSILTDGDIKREMGLIQKYRLQRVIIEEMIKRNYYNIPETIIQKCINCDKYFEDKYSSIKDDPIKFHAFLNESNSNIGFFSICVSCKNQKKQEIFNCHKETSLKIKEKKESCENQCWKCIEMTSVSLKSTVINSNGLENVSKSKEPSNQRSNFFLNPSECTMSSCEIYKEKRKLTFAETRCTQKLNLLELLDW